MDQPRTPPPESPSGAEIKKLVKFSPKSSQRLVLYHIRPSQSEDEARKQKLVSLNTYIEDLTAKIEAATEENQSLEQSAQLLAETNAKMVSELFDKSQEIKDNQAMIFEMDTRLAPLQVKYENLQDTEAELKEEMETLEKEVNELHSKALELFIKENET
jgi:chromosome segregation ATPase